MAVNWTSKRLRKGFREPTDVLRGGRRCECRMDQGAAGRKDFRLGCAGDATVIMAEEIGFAQRGEARATCQ